MAKITENTKSFLMKCKRVWHALKKPTRKEFETIAKISAIGIVVLGTIGFLISLLVRPFVPT